MDQQTQDHGKQQRRVFSLSWVFSLAVAALVVAAVIGVGSVAQQHLRNSLHREVETRLVLEARNLAHVSADALLDEFPELSLMPMVQQIQEDRPELAFVVVLDHEGRIQGHADPRQFGQVFVEPAGLASVAGSAHDGNLRTSPDLIVASVAVQHRDGQELGMVLVGLRRSYVDDVVSRSRKALMMVSAILLVVGVFGAGALMHVMLRPVSVLKAGIARIGQGDLETPMNLQDRTELGMLAETVDEMAARIKASQTLMLEKNRLDHEMDLAHSIQVSLMPDRQIACGRFAAEGLYQAASEVGGDYFDAFELPGDKLGVFMADVAGKGLGGCLVTSMLAALVKARRDRYDSPAELLTALDRDLNGSLSPGVFVTAIYGILDPDRGRLTFASAAHCPLLLARPAMGVVEEYRSEGVPLGIIPHAIAASSYHDTTVLLGPGDLALLYTDGLTEAPRCGDGEEFGQARVEEILRRANGQGHGPVLESLQAAVTGWQGHESRFDDLTLLLVGCPGHVSKLPETSQVSGNAGNLIGDLKSEDELTQLTEGAMHLQVSARSGGSEQIGDWMKALMDASLGERDLGLLELALSEHINNVFEHGYLGRPGAEVDLWWYPATSEHALAGWVMVRDRGRSCPPASVEVPDLENSDVRKRGRGLGWALIRTLTEQLEYRTLLNIGNVCAIKPAVDVRTPEEEPLHV